MYIGNHYLNRALSWQVRTTAIVFYICLRAVMIILRFNQSHKFFERSINLDRHRFDHKLSLYEQGQLVIFCYTFEDINLRLRLFFKNWQLCPYLDLDLVVSFLVVTISQLDFNIVPFITITALTVIFDNLIGCFMAHG